jgi:acyl-[acyl-carrier-protein]-phospholipid O-acyltransferase / long-chain-fatty-acid--[acyl-carrier-protein] ligase
VQTAVVDQAGADTREGLASRSFLCLVIAQTLGALNDNMFRWLAVPIGQHLLGGRPQDLQFALSAGVFCFTLPYLAFATHAGWLADRFSKRTVIVWCKFAEIVIMALAIAAVATRNTYVLFAVVAMTGTQSALFGPSKFGSIPEILKTEKLSTGNGIMALVTVVASAAGTVVALLMYDATQPDGTRNIWLPTVVLCGTGLLGWLASLGIRPLPAARPDVPFPANPVVDTWSQLQMLGRNRPLLRTALGIAFFWTLASLAQLNVTVFGETVLNLMKKDIGPLMGILVAGVGLGSVLAGIWSGGRVELGIVPLGAGGIVVCGMALYFTGNGMSLAGPGTQSSTYFWSCVWLFLLGASAGLFSIPLETFLQHRSPAATRGTLLAASNFLSFAGIFSTSGILYVMQNMLQMSAPATFLAMGLGTIPIALYVFLLLPQATIRFLLWLASHTIYRVRVTGRENLPETGGALLVANHVTWMDGLLVFVSSSRPVRMLAYSDYVQGWLLTPLMKLAGVIPIKGTGGPKALLQSLELARDAVRNGELVCIFAEGQLTRTGQLQPFQRGLLRIVNGTGAPVIPVYLDGLWGSIFSFFEGKYFWKWPRKWPYPVGIAFGRALPEPDNVHQVRQAVEQLGVQAVEQRKNDAKILPRRFLRTCRRSMFRDKVADSAGQVLSGGQLLLRTLIVKRLLERLVLGPEDKMVGVLLPPSVGGVLVNAALPLSGRVPVNLNYTASSATINSCIAQCKIRHVLTSRLFITKMKLEIDGNLIFLEDFKEKPTLFDKLIAGVQAYATPVFALERLFGLTSISPDELLTVIFTSGSTGDPKGVMLSHHNILSNVDVIEQLFQLKKTDAMLGVLPFFHSFGFTGTIWTVLSLEPKGVYHFNPLDARVIGTLSEQHKVTIIMTTPTFLRTYMKRCEKSNFPALDLVVVGAEKMPVDLAQAFDEKFGVRPIEGYGTTELSPVAAVNVPDHRSSGVYQKGTKEGTVGRCTPGSMAKVVDPDSGADLGVDQPGLLLIKGPNVMQGYLGKPDKTAEVVRDGWYVTGDMAKIDAEGFIQITDRLSRFSKIGGEMVPHIKVEEVLQKVLADGSEDDQELKVVVTAVPDDRKGERLIVVHKPLKKSLDEVVAALNSSGLPNLWVPSRDSFLQVDDIPHLGTGKVDLRGLKSLALQRFGQKSE